MFPNSLTVSVATATERIQRVRRGRKIVDKRLNTSGQRYCAARACKTDGQPSVFLCVFMPKSASSVVFAAIRVFVVCLFRGNPSIRRLSFPRQSEYSSSVFFAAIRGCVGRRFARNPKAHPAAEMFAASCGDLRRSVRRQSRPTERSTENGKISHARERKLGV